jgi:hypothetical protein
MKNSSNRTCPVCDTPGFTKSCSVCGHEKPKPDKKPKAPKEEPTERELVHKYVNRVIMNQIYHGRIDDDRFAGLKQDKAVNKNLWMDADFFFSVVFQSSEQKYQFLEGLKAKLGVEFDSMDEIQIVNGLLLAKAFGIELKEVESKDYPTGNIDLMPFVLDNEEI